MPEAMACIFCDKPAVAFGPYREGDAFVCHACAVAFGILPEVELPVGEIKITGGLELVRALEVPHADEA